MSTTMTDANIPGGLQADQVALQVDALLADAGKKEPQVEAAKALVPATPTVTALASYTTPDQRDKLVCANLLTETERSAAQAEARKVLPDLVGNINVLMVYGTDSADVLNELINRALAAAGKKDIPEEMKVLLHQMQDSMRGVQKFDVSQPEVRKKFNKNRRRFLGFLWQLKTMLQMLIEEAQSVSSQVDGVGKKVRIKSEEAMEDANLFAALLKANDRATRLFVQKIAVLEYVRALVLAEFKSIKVDENDPSQYEQNKRRQELGRVLHALNIRIGDFQARLMDAIASGPEFSD
jgi:uncharacterized protein YaaN involved in tellurite resistance